MDPRPPAPAPRPTARGFSLIELIVAVGVFLVLVALVAPSLSGGRRNAQALVCAANTRSMAQGLAAYANQHGDRLPPSFAPADPGSTPEAPTWSTAGGLWPDGPVIHWTFMAFGVGIETPDRAFLCPAAPDGGAPAARPRSGSSESWQRSVAPPSDWQPSRLAYTANGALLPPGDMLDHRPRRAVLVETGRIERPEQTILTTEFYHDAQVGWRAIAESNQLSRSHRPVMPFIAGSLGAHDVFAEPMLGTGPRFFLPSDESIFTLGQLSRMLEVFNVVNLITSDAVSSINAVGRSHPGPGGRTDAGMGGAANFSFADGHVERRDALDTVRRRLWGERFYGISGHNAVHPTERVAP